MGFIRWLYYFSLLFAFMAAVWRYKSLDKASRIFAMLLAISCLTEIIAYYAAKKFHNNYFVYNAYCCIELLFLCLYFNYSIDVFKKTNAGIYIGIVGFLTGGADLLWLEQGSLHRGYAAFVFLEYIIIISLCLFALARMLVQPGVHLITQLHFRLTTALVFFFSVTFPCHYIYDYVVFVSRVGGRTDWLMQSSYLLINIAFYFAIVVVFLKYPKLQKDHG